MSKERANNEEMFVVNKRSVNNKWGKFTKAKIVNMNEKAHSHFTRFIFLSPYDSKSISHCAEWGLKHLYNPLSHRYYMPDSIFSPVLNQQFHF